MILLFQAYVAGGKCGANQVNLTLDADWTETARALGLNMSRLAEAAIAAAAKAERNRLWRVDNQKAIADDAERLPGTVCPGRSSAAFDGWRSLTFTVWTAALSSPICKRI